MFTSTTTEEPGTMIGGQLLKEHLSASPPDMSPFFLRQYVKGHAGDVFEPYPQLLTEMVLRLPYQVHKYAESTVVQPAFEQVKSKPLTVFLYIVLLLARSQEINSVFFVICAAMVLLSL